MSGPKGGTYRIISEEERRRQLEAAELAHQRRRLAALRVQLAALTQRAHAERAVFGTAICEVPAVPVEDAVSTSQDVRREADRLEVAITTIRNRLETDVAAARDQLVAGTSTFSDLTVDDWDLDEHAASVRASRSEARAGSSGRRAPERTESIRRCVASVSPDADGSDVAEVAALAERLLAAVEGPSQGGLMRLQELADRANRRVRARVLREARLGEIAGSLAPAIADPAVADLVAELDRLVVTRPRDDAEVERAVDSLSRRAEAALRRWREDEDRARRSEERERVATALRESFAALGYSVEEGFDTALAERGYAHARLDESGVHALVVRLGATSSTLSVNVVRDASANVAAADDAAAEHRFCGALPALLAATAVRGVEISLASRAAAGELPVARVDLTETRFDERASRGRERERGHQ